MPTGVYCFKLSCQETTTAKQQHFIKIGHSHNVAQRMSQYKARGLWGRFVVDEVENIAPFLWRKTAHEAQDLEVHFIRKVKSKKFKPFESTNEFFEWSLAAENVIKEEWQAIIGGASVSDEVQKRRRSSNGTLAAQVKCEEGEYPEATYLSYERLSTCPYCVWDMAGRIQGTNVRPAVDCKYCMGRQEYLREYLRQLGVQEKTRRSGVLLQVKQHGEDIAELKGNAAAVKVHVSELQVDVAGMKADMAEVKKVLSQASSLRGDVPLSPETPFPATPPLDQADSNASSHPMSPDLDAGRVPEPYSPGATTVPGSPTHTRETSHIIDITGADHEWDAHLRENAQGQQVPHKRLRTKQTISESSSVKANNQVKAVKATTAHAFSSDSVKEASRLQFRRFLDQRLKNTMGTAYEESMSTSNYGFREVPLRKKHPRVPV
jgi:hypothetical protein